MVHLIVWRVASEEALDFWEQRLTDAGVLPKRAIGSIRFQDPEGLDLELRVVETDEDPLIADHPEIPKELALQGFEGVRAYTADVAMSEGLLIETLGFEAPGNDRFVARGGNRSSFYAYDPAPGRGLQGAGTVHHVAWASTMEEHEAWRERVAAAGMDVTPVIDRFWFKSIYFREPSGVLFEIATLGPGFDVDEPLETLGQKLTLPPNFEHLRDKLQDLLTPLPDPRPKS